MCAKIQWTVLVAAALFTVAGVSEAGLKKAPTGGALDAAAVCNPKPSAGDMTLPMPNGLTMVFRAVAIPGANILYDKKFRMGVNETDEDRALYERRVDGYVGAPFVSANLPKVWLKALPQDERQGYSFYFIGKYEITNAQWVSVMGGDIKGKPDAPKANISWSELQEFFAKYNEWLLANHATDLPSVDGEPGYLRLPTEEEWEFAARGGNLPPEKLDFEDFPKEDGKKIEDYAVFGSRYSEPMSVGSKRANPLGLYDMAGNVAELVQTSFRFTIADASSGTIVRRLHGAHGGLVSKGGSFLSTEERDMFPGRRVETRMYVKSGAAYELFRARSVGARCVVASLNFPSARRAMELVNESHELAQSMPTAVKAVRTEQVKAQEKNSSLVRSMLSKILSGGETGHTEDKAVTLDPSGQPVAELDKIILSAGSPVMKKNLSQLRGILEDTNAALRKARDADGLKTLRSIAYEASALRNYAFRCWYLMEIIKDAKIDGAGREKIRAKSHELLAMVQASTNLYRARIEEAAADNNDEIVAHFAQLRKEYAGTDALSVNMRKNIDSAELHVRLVQSAGIDSLSAAKVQEDVIPTKIRQAVRKLEVF